MTDLNRLIHERDTLLDQVQALARELGERDRKHRHWMSITCDRCKTSLTLSSATEVHLAPAMIRVIAAQAWSISEATARDLLSVGFEDKDLCATCRSLTARNSL